jgi:hypothetical protein
VLASVITYHTSAIRKEDFDVVLQFLLQVGIEARTLIMSETTAWLLSVGGGPVIMFRGHARLQPSNQPGVNTVSRELPELPRYLSFARSAATLDRDPHYGFLWNDFLQAISEQTLPSVNPRSAQFDVQPVFGPGRAAMPVGRVVPLENPPAPHVNLDVAADVVNNFLVAWEHHNNLALHDGANGADRVFHVEEGPVAMVEWPAAGPPPAAVPAQGVQMAAPPVPVPTFVVQQEGQMPQVSQAQFLLLQQQLTQQMQQLQTQQQQFFQYQQQVNASHTRMQQSQQVPALVVPPQPYTQPLLRQQGHQGGPALSASLIPGLDLNIFGLQDFSYFPPTFSMNSASAAQLGKFATIAGATNTWTRRAADSFPLKIQSYPRGNVDGADGKPRSRVFDIPYATNTTSEQYVFITDEPTQLIQRENILECFIGNCRAWSQYILPLVGGDPRRMPVFVGSLKDVLANIHHLALGFGTQECVVLRVCHLISVQNISSCLTPGDAHTLLNPLDISSNYFQGALTKMITENRSRLPPAHQQQGRRPLAGVGVAPARQEGGGHLRGREIPAAPAPQGPAGNRGGGGAVPQVDSLLPAPGGSCRRFWYGEVCSFIQLNGQPCRFRHCCRTCRAVVPPAETAAHLRSHII